MSLYESELEIERHLPRLEATNTNDFEINENISYVMASMKHFFDKKIALDEDEERP